MSDSRRAIPLSVPVLAGNEWAYVKDALDSGWVSASGKYVTQLEEAVRELTGAAYAVACTSGTAALHVALEMAGVGAGDAVLVPTITFIASANAVRYCGAEPILLDCDEYLNVDVEALDAYMARCWDDASGQLRDSATGRRIQALMPVHVYGNLCDMERIMEISDRYHLAVIEDATESLGSTYTSGRFSGRHAGTIGTTGALSFNGNKIITTGGGGMILTDDSALAERARYLTTQAKDDAVRFVHGAVGYNYRLSNVLAAIGVAQLEELPGFIKVKRDNWRRYREGLADIPGLTWGDAPPGTDSNRWFYSLVVEPTVFGMDRAELMQRLAQAGIETRPLWLPIHMQPPYSECQIVGAERAVWYWERVLSLPCSSDLSAEDVDYVTGTIRALSRSQL